MKLNIINKGLMGFLAAMAALSSCRKDFKTINTNPNGVVEATPGSLLAPALYDVVTANQTRDMRLNNVLMQDHVPLSNGNDIQRFVVRPSESDYMWNNWYLNLTNFRDMYEKAAQLQDTTLMGISLICQTWVASQITDMYGDVPYSEANQGKMGNYQPAFDRQEDIYKDMLQKLRDANAYLALNKAATSDQQAQDPLYKGVPLMWRKFGNSLYLRLLMRVSTKTELHATDTIKKIIDSDPADYPMFSSNTESAVLPFTGTPPYISAFYNYRDYDFNGSVSLSQFFVNQLNAWNDPRLTVWATEASLGVYMGVPAGYADGNVPDQLSTYLTALKNDSRLGNIMNYAEVQFLLAEAALKGYISGDPKSYYDNGVTNAVTFWGVSLPAGYLVTGNAAWNNNATQEQKLEKIITQKYFDLFFTDFQQWTEYRRTGYPVLPVGPGMLNEGKVPSRFVYPVYEQTLNPSNYQAAAGNIGGDNMNTKVWWNQ